MQYGARESSLSSAAASVVTVERLELAVPSGARVSVCVATRDRGERITPLLESLKRLHHDAFEVIVVDQSLGVETRAAYLAAVGDDPRFSYVGTNTAGKPIATNIAVARAGGRILAFTDDDCVARDDWLTGIEDAFARYPQAGAICGGVAAGEYDPHEGFIPFFAPVQEQLFRSRWEFFRVPPSLMGANLAVRAQAVRDVGGFDEAIGPGAPFRTGDDYDIVLRLIRAGHGVLVLPGSVIVHYGLRSHGSQMRALTWNNSVAHAAIDVKHIRLLEPAILPTLAVRIFGDTVLWGNVLRLRRPTGLARLAAFASGIARAARYPLDRRAGTYARRRAPAGQSRQDMGQSLGGSA